MRESKGLPVPVSVSRCPESTLKRAAANPNVAKMQSGSQQIFNGGTAQKAPFEDLPNILM
jgi:hypothetical protein